MAVFAQPLKRPQAEQFCPLGELGLSGFAELDPIAPCIDRHPIGERALFMRARLLLLIFGY